jgi:hypothetical protein
LLTFLDHDRVLPVALRLVDGRDTLAFLREWYVGGWLPRDEPLVRRWAAHALSADEYETLLGGSASGFASTMSSLDWFVPTGA